MEERRSAGNEEEQSYFNEETPCPSAPTAMTNAPLTSAQTMNQNYETKEGKVMLCVVSLLCWFPPDVLNCFFGILNTSDILADATLNLKAGVGIVPTLTGDQSIAALLNTRCQYLGDMIYLWCLR